MPVLPSARLTSLTESVGTTEAVTEAVLFDVSGSLVPPLTDTVSA